MSEEDIKSLVVDDKWLATLDAAVRGEIDRISQSLTQRGKELAERYALPMPEISKQTSILEDKVNRHLVCMGFEEVEQVWAEVLP